MMHNMAIDCAYDSPLDHGDQLYYGSMVSRCMFLMCSMRLYLCRVRSGHIGHLNGLYPECSWQCLVILSLRANVILHPGIGHRKWPSAVLEMTGIIALLPGSSSITYTNTEQWTHLVRQGGGLVIIVKI